MNEEVIFGEPAVISEEFACTPEVVKVIISPFWNCLLFLYAKEIEEEEFFSSNTALALLKFPIITSPITKSFVFPLGPVALLIVNVGDAGSFTSIDS